MLGERIGKLEAFSFTGLNMLNLKARPLEKDRTVTLFGFENRICLEIWK